MSNSTLLNKARKILADTKRDSLSVVRHKYPPLEILTVEEAASKSTPPVMAVSPTGPTIEPADLNAKAVYWETGDCRILGPAVPEFFMKDRDTFWIVTTFQGGIWWINVDQLRSKKAFNTQPLIRTLELLRELH